MFVSLCMTMNEDSVYCSAAGMHLLQPYNVGQYPKLKRKCWRQYQSGLVQAYFPLL